MLFVAQILAFFLNMVQLLEHFYGYLGRDPEMNTIITEELAEEITSLDE